MCVVVVVVVVVVCVGGRFARSAVQSGILSARPHCPILPQEDAPLHRQHRNTQGEGGAGR